MIISAVDVDDLSAGAALLGSGGGGDTTTLADLLRHTLTQYGPVRLIDPTQLPAEALVVPVGAAGSITVMLERLPSGREFVQAVHQIGHHLETQVAAVHGFEIGGANALVAVAAAAWTGLPLVDGDGMGRAFNGIDQVTFNAGGLSATPIALADPSGNQMLISSQDNSSAERLLRAAISAMGGWAANAIYPMRASQAAEHAITGSYSKAIALGRKLRDAQHRPRARVGMLTASSADLLFSGTILEVLRYLPPRTGATLSIEHHNDPRRTLRVEMADEYLLTIDDGQVTACVPDIICLLDTRTWQCITTEDVTAGRHVDVIRLPAPSQWRTSSAYHLVAPASFGLRLLEPLLGRSTEDV
ncbi:DUF917 domain-containing protein [Streptosporangium sp. NPDC048047]|uniref:DUF917 domain-containing protein n=1 Tax=Streptosporangium sp. NPDC048047 TaxID=3155748 RepID=UPI003434425B